MALFESRQKERNMKQTKEYRALLAACAACETACINNAIESANTSGQDRVSKCSTGCAGECRELRQQLARNPVASSDRCETACIACVAECEKGGPLTPIRKVCIESCKALITASIAATKVPIS